MVLFLGSIIFVMSRVHPRSITWTWYFSVPLGPKPINPSIYHDPVLLIKYEGCAVASTNSIGPLTFSYFMSIVISLSMLVHIIQVHLIPFQIRHIMMTILPFFCWQYSYYFCFKDSIWFKFHSFVTTWYWLGRARLLHPLLRLPTPLVALPSTYNNVVVLFLFQQFSEWWCYNNNTVLILVAMVTCWKYQDNDCYKGMSYNLAVFLLFYQEESFFFYRVLHSFIGCYSYLDWGGTQSDESSNIVLILMLLSKI